jgi:hypothetical protein
VRYPAGIINPRHTHPCAKAFFMEHGAGAEGDVTVLLITNKRFEIHYSSARFP